MCVFFVRHVDKLSHAHAHTCTHVRQILGCAKDHNGRCSYAHVASFCVMCGPLICSFICALACMFGLVILGLRIAKPMWLRSHTTILQFRICLLVRTRGRVPAICRANPKSPKPLENVWIYLWARLGGFFLPARKIRKRELVWQTFLGIVVVDSNL